MVAFFVVLAKSNLKFRSVESRKVEKPTALKCDQSIRLSVDKGSKHYPNKIRRIKYYDSEMVITLICLTNYFELDAL